MNLAEEIAFKLEGAYVSLPGDRKRVYDELADDLYGLLNTDDDFHEGCFPHDVVDDARREGRAAGYGAACDDVLERLRELTGVLGDPAMGQLRATVARVTVGVARLKARGPK